MEILDSYRQHGVRLLYCDTDSIIFRYPKRLKEEIYEKLEVAEFFGHLKDEKKNWKILEYVCAGAKQYALKVRFLKTIVSLIIYFRCTMKKKKHTTTKSKFVA